MSDFEKKNKYLVFQRSLCQGTEPCHMQGPPIQNAVHVQRLFFYLATGGFLLSPTAICAHQVRLGLQAWIL